MNKFFSKLIFISVVFSLANASTVFAHQKAAVVHKPSASKTTLAQAQTGSNAQSNTQNSTSSTSDSSANSGASTSTSSNSNSLESQSSSPKQDNSSDPDNHSTQPDNKSMPNYPSNPTNDNQSSLSDSPETEKWAVKVGSYTNSTELKKSVALLQKRGFDGFIKEIKNGSKVTSEVYVGPTKERAAAEKLNNKLKQSHIKGKVVNTDFDEQA